MWWRRARIWCGCACAWPARGCATISASRRPGDEYDLGDQNAYWDAAYREVIGAGRPAQGVIALDAWKQPNVFQFWLRLPLADAEGRIAMVLGHDAFLQSEKAHALAERANLRIA